MEWPQSYPYVFPFNKEKKLRGKSQMVLHLLLLNGEKL